MKNSIRISYQHKHQLAREFGVTTEAVRQALEGITKRGRARAIRKRAKELLEEEYKKAAATDNL